MNWRFPFLVFILLSFAAVSGRISAQEIANEEELQAQLQNGKKFLGQAADRGAALFSLRPPMRN